MHEDTAIVTMTTNQTTRALVLEAPEAVQVREVPLPEPGPGEVTLRTLACGVCGSDLRYFVGDNPWAQHTLGRQEPVDWGRTILGHEVCAVIEAVGPGVTTRKTGEVVAVLPSYPCGACRECRAGDRNLCKQVSHLGHGGGWPTGYDRSHFPGAMSDRFLYFADSCFPVPEGDATPDEFSLTDMVAVGVHSVKRASQVRARGLGAGTRALVIGCGQVGLSIAQTARARGAEVAGIDPSTIARRIAEAVRISCAPSLEGIEAAASFDAVFDTVCTPETITAALARLAAGGALVLLAPHEMTFGIPPLAVGGERSVTTSCNFDPPEDFEEAIRLIASRQVDVRPYITRRVSLTDAPATFAHLHESRDEEFKVVIQPESGGK